MNVPLSADNSESTKRVRPVIRSYQKHILMSLQCFVNINMISFRSCTLPTKHYCSDRNTNYFQMWFWSTSGHWSSLNRRFFLHPPVSVDGIGWVKCLNHRHDGISPSPSPPAPGTVPFFLHGRSNALHPQLYQQNHNSLFDIVHQLSRRRDNETFSSLGAVAYG
jgi:hypothetical protein